MNFRKFRWWHSLLGIYALGLSGLLIIFLVTSSRSQTEHFGPYKVCMKQLTPLQSETHRIFHRIHLADPKLKCWYPDLITGNSLPVILLFPATRLQSRNFSLLGQRLASHGFFVVISAVKVHSIWRSIFSWKWKGNNTDHILQKEDIISIIHHLERLNLSDPDLTSKLLLQCVGFGTRLNLAMSEWRDTVTIIDEHIMKQGVFIATIEISQSREIHYRSGTIIPFAHTGQIGTTPEEKDGIFRQMMDLVRSHVNFQRFLPVRMVRMLLERINEFDGKSYINICDPVKACINKDTHQGISHINTYNY